MPKSFQNEAKNDAKTHQKSMPELVSDEIMKIIKNHVSLKNEIIELLKWTKNEATI